MTTREFLIAVVSADLGNEMTIKANEMITALDHKNDLRREKPSKASLESKTRRDAVVAFLLANEGDHSRDEIAVACNMTEGQATSACTALVKNGVIHKATIKVDKATKVVYGIDAE